MGVPGIAARLVGEDNAESAVRFLIEWVSDGEAEARTYPAGHAAPEGASLIAAHGPDAVGFAAIVWEPNYAGFRRRGIPLVHQIAVAGPCRRRGVATLLLDAAEQLARDRGIATIGITVGLSDEYGPAQRLYAQRGYIPDGRGAAEHVRVRPGDPHPGIFGEPPQAPGGGVTVPPHAAAVEQDRPAGAGADRPVYGPPDRWWQRDQDDLGAFAAHAQDPVTVFFTERPGSVRASAR